MNKNKNNTAYLMRWAADANIQVEHYGTRLKLSTIDGKHSVYAQTKILGLYDLWDKLNPQRDPKNYFN